jgi:putative FmdB family regulatory protein
MPVYEYRCTKCQKVFEYQQRMADAAKTTCEECSGALERLISRSSFALKGDGWYKDLYSSAKPAATTTEAAPTSTESKPAATESKPAATESKPAATETKPSGSGSSGGGTAASGSS